MTKRIETKLVSPPHSRRIYVDCANCFNRFHFTVPVSTTGGFLECCVCGAKTSWQEVDELTTLEKDAMASTRIFLDPRYYPNKEGKDELY